MLGRLTAAAVLFAACLGSSATGAPLSDAGIAQPSPAQIEDIAQIYVNAVNGEAGVEAYLQRNREDAPVAAIRNFFADQRWINGGGIDLVGAQLRKGSPTVVELAVRGRLYGAVQGVELTVQGPSALAVTALDLTPAPDWAITHQASVSRNDFAERVAGLIDKGCAAGVFSGAVLVAAGKDVLVQRACGEATRRYHVANRASTRFNIGSMDKMFTVVAAMRLAEAGKLSLDAPLDRYLDQTWLDPETARRITVWHLMAHTSGLQPDVADLIQDQPRPRFRQLDDYKRLVKGARPSFEPGTRFEYSNTGSLLLGAVIAQASGQDYYAHVSEHIFRPTGMAATGSYDADDPVEDLAIGYMRAPASPYGWRENTMRGFQRGIPAGGGYSTVGDLHRFALALRDGKLISPASLQRLWEDGDRDNYGAGFEIGHGAVGASVGHSGLYGGVSTRMRLYLERGYIAVVLANMDRAAPPLLDAIEGEILRAPTVTARSHLKPPTAASPDPTACSADSGRPGAGCRASRARSE